MIKKILISQPAPAPERSPYKGLIEKFQLDVVFHPFIKVIPVSEREFRDQKVNILDHTAVIFSSRHAIDHYFRMCQELRLKISDDMRYYGVSEKVILYIQKYVQYRKRKIFFSPTGKWADLVPALMKHKTGKFLVPQSNIRNDELTELLDQKKLKHTECELYHTVPNNFEDGTSLNNFDAIVLFTPSGVRSLVQNFPEWEQGDTKLICFGETTCRALEGTNLRLDFSPDKSQVSSIAEALDKYIAEQNA